MLVANRLIILLPTLFACVDTDSHERDCWLSFLATLHKVQDDAFNCLLDPNSTGDSESCGEERITGTDSAFSDLAACGGEGRCLDVLDECNRQCKSNCDDDDDGCFDSCWTSCRQDLEDCTGWYNYTCALACNEVLMICIEQAYESAANNDEYLEGLLECSQSYYADCSPGCVET